MAPKNLMLAPLSRPSFLLSFDAGVDRVSSKKNITVFRLRMPKMSSAKETVQRREGPELQRPRSSAPPAALQKIPPESQFSSINPWVWKLHSEAAFAHPHVALSPSSTGRRI